MKPSKDPMTMILRDPVHGLVSFEHAEATLVPQLLTTAEVQRLRRIRQLGLTSLAFPGAEHTRFSHAIGAAHVMIQFIGRVRQIHDTLPFWQQLTSERARDAIVAALLHDIGHGPLSHLFEQATPMKIKHEDWTEKIILDSTSEVHQVLLHCDASMPHRVAQLVRGKHELPYLAKAVSGTLDVDRCDYLLRDAYFTGVTYGQFDLPWLLRSLVLNAENTTETIPPGLAIDGLKGVTAIESFILARFFMFQQVYFHKSTRAAEWMIGAILRRAIENLMDGTKLPSVPRALESITAGVVPDLQDYLALDDTVLLSAIHEWENAHDPVLRDLCKRLRERRLLKTRELFIDRSLSTTSRSNIEKHFSKELQMTQEIAQEHGFDPSVYVGLDIAKDTPYADDASLHVAFANGSCKKPHEVSFLLERLRNESVLRARLIFPGEIRPILDEVLAH